MKKRYMPASGAFVAVVALSAALVSGCATGDEGATSETVTIGIPTNPTGAFDPYGNREYGTSLLTPFNYDSLINKNASGEFVSGIATEWTADTESAQFTLGSGVTCADGSPLTASAVANSIAFASDGANASWVFGFFAPTTPLTAVGDDATGIVTVTMSGPYGYLLDTIGLLPILCAGGLENPDSLANASNGTGPYVVTEVVPGQSISLELREDYAWGPGGATAEGMPAKVIVREVPNETTVANMLLSGELDAATVSGPDRSRLQGADVSSFDLLASAAWLNFNQRDTRVTNDLRVREALVRALNLSDIVAVSTGGNGQVAEGLLVEEPSVCPTNAVAGVLPEFDTNLAGELLDEAGWIVGSDGVRAKDGQPLHIELRYWSERSDLEKPTAEFMADAWSSIGVDVEVIAESVGGLVDTLYSTGNFDAYLLGWDLRLGTQFVPYLTGTLPPEGQNFMGVDNSAYEELAAEATITTPPEGCELWGEAERAVVEDLDLVPMSNRTITWFFPGVTADVVNALQLIPTSIRAN